MRCAYLPYANLRLRAGGRHGVARCALTLGGPALRKPVLSTWLKTWRRSRPARYRDHRARSIRAGFARGTASLAVV